MRFVQSNALTLQYLKREYCIVEFRYAYNICFYIGTHGRPAPVQFKQNNVLFKLSPFVPFFIDNKTYYYNEDYAHIILYETEITNITMVSLVI